MQRTFRDLLNQGIKLDVPSDFKFIPRSIDSVAWFGVKNHRAYRIARLYRDGSPIKYYFEEKLVSETEMLKLIRLKAFF